MEKKIPSQFSSHVVAIAKAYLIQWKMAQGRFTNALLQPMMDGDGAQA